MFTMIFSVIEKVKILDDSKPEAKNSTEPAHSIEEDKCSNKESVSTDDQKAVMLIKEDHGRLLAARYVLINFFYF